MGVCLIFIFCLLHTYFLKAIHPIKNISEGINDSVNTSEIRKLRRTLNAFDYNTRVNGAGNLNIRFLEIDNGCSHQRSCFNTNSGKHEGLHNLRENRQTDLEETIDSNLSRVPIEKQNKTFIDYVLASTVNKTYSTHQNVYLWPENVSSGYYEVPIILDSVSTITKQRLLYVFGYLARGVKIWFRDSLPTDEIIVKVTENDMQGCWANLGKGDGYGILYINIPPLLCNSVYMVLHEVMHILGCVHVHERNSGKYKYFRQSNEVYIETQVTVYDDLSVMIYPNKASRIATKNGQQIIRNIVRGRQPFISRCDWNFIMQLYPSGQVAPECIANHMPDLLIPTPSLLKYLDRVAATHLCRYQNEFFFDVGYCETNSWNFYPLIQEELAPITKNETINVKSFCDMQNVCNGFVVPYNVNQAEDANITFRPLENQFVLVYLEKSFCENFLYRFIIVLHKLPFYDACLEQCQRTVRINTLIKCFRRNYRLYQQTGIFNMYNNQMDAADKFCCFKIETGSDFFKRNKEL